MDDTTDTEAPGSIGHPGDSLHVLGRIRTMTQFHPRVEFESFIAATIAYGLTLAGSRFTDAEISRALEALLVRSPKLYYTEPEIAFIEQRAHKPKAPRPTAKKKLGKRDPRKFYDFFNG